MRKLHQCNERKIKKTIYVKDFLRFLVVIIINLYLPIPVYDMLHKMTFNARETFNPNQAGGGQICPPVGKTLNISGTKSRIDLKPGCKFKFVVCLETYLN